MTQNDKKIYLTLYLRNCTSQQLWFLVHMCKMMISSAIFLKFFQNSNFSGFSKFINECEKEIPHLLHMCVILLSMLTICNAFFCILEIDKKKLKKLFKAVMTCTFTLWLLNCFWLLKFKMMITPDAFFIFFWKFWFSGFLRGGIRAKNDPKWQKNLSHSVSQKLYLTAIVVFGTHV